MKDEIRGLAIAACSGHYKQRDDTVLCVQPFPLSLDALSAIMMGHFGYGTSLSTKGAANLDCRAVPSVPNNNLRRNCLSPES